MKNITRVLLTVLLCTGAATPAKAQSFSFGSAGDFASGSNFKATVEAVARENPAFFLTVGDHSYKPGAENVWCSAWKSMYNNILVVAGNHDVGEGTGGNIDNYVQHCPFTLSGLQGKYGYQYFFDYPAASPLARFIMITPGLKSDKYPAGSAGYTFVSNAVDEARAKGIKWVIVGMHKNYISIMEKPNELGNDLIPMLLNKKVDLILQGHEHGYERSKQLKCAKVNTYDPACVVDADNNMVKGAGTILHVLGTGGQGLRGMNTGDSEYNYFATADVTTYGFGKFTVTPTQMSYNFVRSAGGNFTDTFVISEGGTAPTPSPTSIPQPSPTPAPSSVPSPQPSPSAPTPSSAPCAAVPNTVGSVTLPVTIPSSGSYTIWTRMMSQGDAANSYYLRVDQDCPIVVGDSNTIPVNSWTWVDYMNGNSGSKIRMNLTGGSHTFTLMSRENGTRIDGLLAVSGSCIPAGDGSNCVTSVSSPIASSAPTAAPTILPSDIPSPIPGSSAVSEGSTIYVSADATVDSRYKDKNFGSSKDLKIDRAPDQITYLRFSLKDRTASGIKRARLRILVDNYSQQLQTLYSLTNTWVEGTVTFNNRPSLGSRIGEMHGGRSGKWVEVDITTAVKMAAGNDLNIALTTEKKDALWFHSREAGTGKSPHIIIE